MQCIGLGLIIGLRWLGLDCVGFTWMGLAWLSLDWLLLGWTVVLDWIALHCMVCWLLYWTAMDCSAV